MTWPAREAMCLNGFAAIEPSALEFATHLESQAAQIVEAMDRFACANVAEDELERSVNLLRNLHRNAEYFTGRVREVTTFLPLNQILYSVVCFGVVPSFQATRVVARPPEATWPAWRRLEPVLNLPRFAPNIQIAYAHRKDAFLAERRAHTDVVIFTGRPENGERVRAAFHRDALFILNGAGHNPVVVTESADLQASVRSCLRIALQNQGQDCAAPNAILVHADIFETWMELFLDAIAHVRSGPYSEPGVVVGPNTDPTAPTRVTERLTRWATVQGACLRYGGNTNGMTRLIEPTVIQAPLRKRARLPEIGLEEWFAPVCVVHPYGSDLQLSWYFEHPAYALHAMYVTMFGESAYIRGLVRSGLHTTENLLINTDLHLEERGWLPYGGTGKGASHVVASGRLISGATLPQREIWRFKLDGGWR